LREAKADWIALLDSDDAWKPARLERLSEVARATSADFVADDLVLWDAVEEKQFKPAHFELRESQKQITVLDVFRADDNFNFSKKSFTLMKPICRLKFLADHKIKYNESMRVSEDFVFLAESLFNGAKIILIDEAYYIYSIPSGPSGRSQHSRSAYQFGSVIEQNDLLAEKYRNRIDPALKRVMNRFRKTMSLLQQSDVARTYLWSGQYAKYLAYLAARPELTRRLVSRATMKIGKRRDARSRPV
jgi:succinoglycan biosynthesis protein ExoO